MNVRRSLLFIGMFTAACLFSSPALADTITNGTFETGTLAGWTVFTTSNGTNGTGLPSVVSFNTTGSGASDAAHFDVGDVTFKRHPAGGGLSQAIVAPVSGLYTFTENFAAQDDADGEVNSDGGIFSLLIDGTTVATDDLGQFSTSLQILRGSFNVSVSLTSGSHTIQTEITRPFTGGGPDTPDQYIDNISLTPNVAATPEPSSIALFGTGLLALAGTARRRFSHKS